MDRVLVVDDEPNIRESFARVLVREGYEVITAERGETAIDVVADSPPDVIVMDIHLPGLDGMETYKRLKTTHPRLPVIIMTGYGTTDLAIQATQLGAVDYQLKPFSPGAMLESIRHALADARLMQRTVALDPEGISTSTDAIIGQSAAMQAVYKDIGRVADTLATVLIRGETGTGKELVARAIYQYSARAAGPLVTVNCVAIPEGLLESELFGHERGAFTGATGRRIGRFEQAHGGTLFLDEVGDLPTATQAKLLRALQERAFERVGGGETIRVDVRVIAATNRDLEEAIAVGAFRTDLYHRLNVVAIHLPPLRQRREDIPRLVGYFMQRSAAKLPAPVPPIADDARTALNSYPWPGNVRELEHCIERLVIYTRGRSVQLEDVTKALQRPTGAMSTTATAEEPLRETIERYLQSPIGPNAHMQMIETVDRLLVEVALRLHDGNQTQAARALGLTRATLWSKVKRYGLGRGSEEPSAGVGG